MNDIKTSTLTIDERKVLLELKKGVLSRLPDAELILYGSMARGDYHEYSDMDLLILTYTNVDRELKNELSWVKYEIELKYDVIISLIIENKKYWNSAIGRILPLHQNIEKEGITV